MPAAGIYIHFPFCRSKCPYCDFYSVTDGSFWAAKFHEALLKEIELSAISRGKAKVDTIFIGGGTPSLAEPAALAAVIDAIRKNFDLESDAEITVECNPESSDLPKLRAYRDCGVNRLSIGVQSFCDAELRRLGRIHDAGRAMAAIDQTKRAGFADLSLDLIYGIPDQTFSSWKKTLETALAFEPSHLSAYCLTLEGGTPMQTRVESGLIEIPDESLQAGFYSILLDMVETSPLRRYEISNFARPGRESRHNLKYWRGLPYLGFGPSAHSYVESKRWSNTADIAGYCADIESGKLPIEHVEEIDQTLRAKEGVMLGLRLAEGVSYAEIEQVIDVVEVRDMADRGLIQLTDDGRLKLSREGLFVCDEIIVRILEEKNK